MNTPSSFGIHLRRRVAPLFLGWAAWSCTGTETGNPTVGKLSLALSSSDSSLVAVGVEDELEMATLRLVEARVGLGSLAFLACDGGETSVLDASRVVDLHAGAPIGDVPRGTFCGVVYQLVPQELGVSSLNPALEGQPLSVTLRFTNQEGGVASMESAETTAVELSNFDAPFHLEGTEDLVVFIDVASLALAHGLDQPFGVGVHIIDPNQTAGGGEPSPIVTSSSLAELGGDELVSGHDLL